MTGVLIKKTIKQKNNTSDNTVAICLKLLAEKFLLDLNLNFLVKLKLSKVIHKAKSDVIKNSNNSIKFLEIQVVNQLKFLTYSFSVSTPAYDDQDVLVISPIRDQSIADNLSFQLIFSKHKNSTG